MTARAAARPADPIAAEALFSAVRNAYSVASAERYFRTMYMGGMSTWNIRDQDMASTLGALQEHLGASTGRQPKIVVWSHNTHTGDARVTEPGEQGELNIGQLMRQKHGAASVLVGFHTYTGTVLAATEWGAPGRVENVRRSLPESYGALFHATGVPNFFLALRDAGPVATALSEPRLQRAIGVIYVPNTERQSHYFNARLGQQFDAVLFFDQTRAVTPLR
jgi:erythromycin esterase-like protein